MLSDEEDSFSFTEEEEQTQEPENYDAYIDKQIQDALNENKGNLERELLQKIPNSECYYNSITAAIGQQNKGKTLSVLKEIIKISQNDPFCHLLVYINKTGEPTDSTFESIKKLIKCPIIYRSHEDAEEYIHQLLLFKQLYNSIKENHYEDKIDDNQKNEMFENLFINDFSKKFCHTLIFLDDAVKSKLIEKKDSDFNQWLTQCRHIQCSIFLAVQYLRGLSTNIKSNLSTVFIFSGFSAQQFNVIRNQINMQIPKEELWYKYTQLSNHGKIIHDCIKGITKFIY